MTRIRIVAFSLNGAALASELISKLQYKYDVLGYYKQEVNNLKKLEGTLSSFVEESFLKANVIIFIGATAIATRLIAPCLKSKVEDPAIITIDDGQNYVIPILSGHIGQANEYAKEIASLIGATPIITTATDINNVFAVDSFAIKNNLKIVNPKMIKYISSHLLEGGKIGFTLDYDIKVKFPAFIEANREIGVYIGDDIVKKPYDKTINLVHKKYVLGIGSRKGISSVIFQRYILDCLKFHNIDIELVSEIVSIDLKKDEKAICDFANKYRIKFTTFSEKQLNSVSGNFSSSAFVKSITGVDSVCERAVAYLVSENNIIVRKESDNGITLAIGIRPFTLEF